MKVFSQLVDLFLAGKRILFITGAGLSCASGIRSYRSGPRAIWSDKVLEWGTTEKFRKDPSLWWSHYWLQTHNMDEFCSAKPNAGHYAITDLSKFCDAHVITQNIDSLHLKSGLSPECLVECHGRIGKYRCLSPCCPFSSSRILSIPDLSVFSTPSEYPSAPFSPPLCPSCGNAVFPMALMFDENYNTHGFFKSDTMEEWISSHDAYVFVGTSFAVGVTSQCVDTARRKRRPAFSINISNEEMKGIRNIVGKAEEILPALRDEVKRRAETKAGRPVLWIVSKSKK
ncbi:NAD-dependent deacetylase sir2E [Aduncisulcus paluster]|uniref:NAD-dependent deacetylase sir2E n=1 Tax=Aduncisulcus paluster TaxID=2918883 RepID=A0ABQ5KRT8_9EUKA|nr:NAD-dependent deacetylase sir2E [Aduncisulcus paluster]